MTAITSSTNRGPRAMRALLTVVLAVSVLVPGLASTPEASASTGPQLVPQEIWKTGFETYPPPGMTIDKNPSPPSTPVSAWWGRITYSKRTGSYGLWCAGNSIANWDKYPQKTSGQALLSLTQLAEYYSSELSFWYTLPSRGAADTYSFQIGWYDNDAPGTWQTYANFPIRAGWEARSYNLSAPGSKSPLSRRPGTILFEFNDFPEGSGQSPATGRGATIDDIAVTGYGFGPVRDLAVSSTAGEVDLAWQKPAYSTSSDSADTRSVVYRVWRQPIGSTTWTEVAGSPTSQTSLTDTGAPAGTTYTYLVQAWGTGDAAAFWGEHRTATVAVDVPIDTQPPVTTASVTGDGTDSVTVTLSATDDISGVAATYNRLGISGDFVLGTSRVITTPGTHTLYFYSVDNAGNEEDPPKSVTFTVASPPIVNVQDDDRYGTAVAASKLAYPERLDPDGARTVIIATGENWPDALGGTSLAGVLDGPVLLVKKNSVPAVVMNEITRLRASEAVILGGTGAVSEDVAKTLATAGLTVNRIKGNDRYETADAIARRVIAAQGEGFQGRAFVATGGDFPDALAAAPLAAAEGRPLYLAKPKTGLSSATMAAMEGITYVVILGGTGAVDGIVETQLIGRQVIRREGDNRYLTAIDVAEYTVSQGHGWDHVGITTGQNFPDALAGGVVQGKSRSVMLLTPPKKLDSDVAAMLTSKKSQIGTVTYFGGLSAVSEDVRAAVADALGR